MTTSNKHRRAIILIALFSLLWVPQCSDSPEGPEPTPTHDFELSAVLSAEGVQLEWAQIEIAGSSGYHVYRSLDSTGGSAVIDTLNIDITQYVDCDIQTDTTYYYRLSAFDGSGSETCSSEIEHVAVSGATLILSASDWTAQWCGSVSDEINVENLCQGSISGWSTTTASFWLTVEGTGGSSTTSFTISADSCFAGSNRTGIVQVNSPDYGTRSVTVQQLALFAAPVSSAAGDSPRSVRAADLDGDGVCDLVVAHYDADGVSVILNNGNGAFAAPVFYSVGNGTEQIRVADVDGDNSMDLIVRSYFDGDIFVLLNNGDGTFAQAVAHDSWDCVIRFDVGDLDSDGDIDVVLGYYTNQIGVLLNDGTGTFAAPIVIDAMSPNSMTLADLDGDSDLDVILANTNLGLMVMFNNGDATFAEGVMINDDKVINSIATADFDGDGNLDLAALQGYHELISIMLNDGAGTFSSVVDHAVSNVSGALVLKDFDSDSDVDLACSTNDVSDPIQIFRNNGDGTFTDPICPTVSYKPGSMCAEDFDGDNDLDLVGAVGSQNQVLILKNSSQ